MLSQLGLDGNSDSEEDILPRPPRPGQPYEWMKAPLKRKSPGSDVPTAKKAKVEEEESQAQTQSTMQTQTQTQPLTQGSTADPPADDSVTEPESEESITEPESDPQTESETEPESDAELPQMVRDAAYSLLESYSPAVYLAFLSSA